MSDPADRSGAVRMSKEAIGGHLDKSRRCRILVWFE